MNVSPPRRLEWLLAAGLTVLLVVNVPVFLCQHLTADAVIYDLQARCALDGGVLYRDIVEPNFPGAVWIHMAVRSLLGWSWLALRAVDLVCLAGIVGLIWRWLGLPGEAPPRQRQLALCLAAFGLYFSLSEWCHCQRDLWMLLPALAALHLRQHNLRRLLGIETAKAASVSISPGRLLLEGILWGAAVWIKPHAGIPAACVLATSLMLSGLSRRSLTSLALVVIGGLLAGFAGSTWLIATGAWPHFWEMQLVWNPIYLQAGRQRMTWSWLGALWNSLAPWSWMHLCAAGTLIVVARRCAAHRLLPQPGAPQSEWSVRLLLLGSLYAGWMLQVLALQHPFAYVHVPGLILALALVAMWRLPVEHQPAVRAGILAIGVLALLCSPALHPQRLAAWTVCLRNGPTPQTHSHVQMEIQPDWKTLGPVLDYLRSLDLQDGELVVYSGRLIHVYSELGLRPPTRFVYLDVLTHLFRQRNEEISQSLQRAPIRYIVSSFREDGLAEEAIRGPTDPATGLPVEFPAGRLSQFPYSQPVVFRSGEYAVYRVSRPLGTLSPDIGPLAKR